MSSVTKARSPSKPLPHAYAVAKHVYDGRIAQLTAEYDAKYKPRQAELLQLTADNPKESLEVLFVPIRRKLEADLTVVLESRQKNRPQGDAADTTVAGTMPVVHLSTKMQRHFDTQFASLARAVELLENKKKAFDEATIQRYPDATKNAQEIADRLKFRETYFQPEEAQLAQRKLNIERTYEEQCGHYISRTGQSISLKKYDAETEKLIQANLSKINTAWQQFQMTYQNKKAPRIQALQKELPEIQAAYDRRIGQAKRTFLDATGMHIDTFLKTYGPGLQTAPLPPIVKQTPAAPVAVIPKTPIPKPKPAPAPLPPPPLKVRAERAIELAELEEQSFLSPDDVTYMLEDWDIAKPFVLPNRKIGTNVIARFQDFPGTLHITNHDDTSLVAPFRLLVQSKISCLEIDKDIEDDDAFTVLREFAGEKLSFVGLTITPYRSSLLQHFKVKNLTFPVIKFTNRYPDILHNVLRCAQLTRMHIGLVTAKIMQAVLQAPDRSLETSQLEITCVHEIVPAAYNYLVHVDCEASTEIRFSGSFDIPEEIAPSIRRYRGSRLIFFCTKGTVHDAVWDALGTVQDSNIVIVPMPD